MLARYGAAIVAYESFLKPPATIAPREIIHL
jgi:hypothetical protein